jgi:hypothetical protein
MFTPEDVLEGARAIRPFLPELIGAETEQIDQQLADLLGKAKAGEQVDQQILEILKSRPKTKSWMAEFLASEQVSKGYQPPPGKSNAVSMPRYACPEGDYVWYQRIAGTLVPSCPTHKCELKLEG